MKRNAAVFNQRRRISDTLFVLVVGLAFGIPLLGDDMQYGFTYGRSILSLQRPSMALELRGTRLLFGER